MRFSGSKINRLDSSERLTLTTTMRGLLRIEIYPRRRWRWWGQRGWFVVLHLLHEQDDAWKCRRFFTDFQELCTQLRIDEDDLVWQCKGQVLPARTGTSGWAKDSGWIPFCMF
jgi:hypothetical protein